MKIAVVDDESKWQDKVQAEIEKYCEGFEVECFCSGEDFLEQDEEYPIVFMDIEMSGKDGFLVSEEYHLRYPRSLIIILTTHTELSRKGYRVQAFRYIDKVFLEEIQEALVSAQVVLKRFHPVKFRVLKQGEAVMICDDILYIESFNHTVRVRTKTDTYQCDAMISVLKEELREFGFFPCHRCFLVNLSHVKDYDKKHVYFRTGEKVDVSRSQYDEFGKAFWNWKFSLGNG